jgi:hypothetical protein
MDIIELRQQRRHVEKSKARNGKFFATVGGAVIASAASIGYVVGVIDPAKPQPGGSLATMQPARIAASEPTRFDLCMARYGGDQARIVQASAGVADDSYAKLEAFCRASTSRPDRLSR